jgi:hypothetical protein
MFLFFIYFEKFSIFIFHLDVDKQQLLALLLLSRNHSSRRTPGGTGVTRTRLRGSYTYATNLIV